MRILVILFSLISLASDAQLMVWNAAARPKLIWELAIKKHKERQEKGLYETNKFVFADKDGFPEIDEAIVSELRSISDDVIVIESDLKARDIAKDYPGYIVFSIDFNRSTSSSTRSSVSFGTRTTFNDVSLFTLYSADEAGDIGAQVINDLFCFPAEVIAKMLVHGHISHYKEFGEFMTKYQKDHFEASKAYHTQNLQSLQNHTMFIADSDLSMKPEDISKHYSGPIEVVSKERIFEMIRNREDVIIMLAPNDDCEFQIDNTKTGNTRYIFNPSTGRCYWRSVDIPFAKGPKRFGFREGDLEYIAKPKLK